MSQAVSLLDKGGMKISRQGGDANEKGADPSSSHFEEERPSLFGHSHQDNDHHSHKKITALKLVA